MIVEHLFTAGNTTLVYCLFSTAENHRGVLVTVIYDCDLQQRCIFGALQDSVSKEDCR